MARFQTVIEPRVLPLKREKIPAHIDILKDVTNMSYNVLLPFLCGILLARTNNVIFLIPLGFFIFFNIRVEYRDNKLKIKVNRG